MDFTITPGHARFTKQDVLMVVDHDDVKIFEIDMHTKYCEVWTGSNTCEITVFITKGERTLHHDTNAEFPTMITFSLPENEADDWTVLAETARYTTRIVLYRVKR